jgi:hypothetical protein
MSGADPETAHAILKVSETAFYGPDHWILPPLKDTKNGKHAIQSDFALDSCNNEIPSPYFDTEFASHQ